MFLHIQGHQDKKAYRPLTIVKQLNVDCDCHAKIYVMSTAKSSIAFGNPDIPEAQPHIHVQGKLICRQLLPALCKALSAPAYSKYLKTKLNWTQSDLLDINWPILQPALASFQPEDQHQIILFINDKLPLRASKVHPHMGSHLCPLCQRENKDTWHFLECMH